MKRIFLSLALCVCLLPLSAQETGTDNDNRTLRADSIITADTRLDSLYQTLPEVLVTGERPIVKAEQGKLIYDLPRLIQNLPVDNAYDAVKELPGVMEVNGALRLAGQSVTLILDGKVTTLSAGQLNTLLKSIPVSRIEKAEVMYNAPARYQVRGALINITLKQATPGTQSLQGEVYGKYAQKYYEDLEQRASLLYTKHKFSLDFLYSHKHGRSYFATDKDAVHTLGDGTVYPLSTDEVNRHRSHTHGFRVGADYNIAKDHQLSFVYNGSYTTGHSRMSVEGTQESSTLSNSNSWLHNGRLDYRTPFGLSGGVDFTYYSSPSNQLLNSIMQGEALDFYTEDRQRINRWKFFLGQEHSLKNGWGLNYGGSYTTSVDNSYQYYYDDELT
ncbi:MAG: signal protein, partial [Bacteroides sp.]|nr:signal protein [Bacteroides sp.]